MTFISRIFGFIRDLVIARIFGANIYTDAFFVAFRLPNLLRRLFAEGAFSQAFVPIIAEYKSKKSIEETKLLINKVASLLFISLLVVSLIGIIASPLIIYVSAPGFVSDQTKYEIATSLFRVCFPYILFISLTALAGGVLNIWGKFAVPSISPALLNITLIVFAIWLSPFFDPPIMALAWGVLTGGIFQLIFQLPFLLRLGVRPKFIFKPFDEGVRKIIKLMGPAIFGVSVSQISLIINMIFASFLTTGSISWLYYADRLMELPVGLLGAALGTALLPRFSASYAERDEESYKSALDLGLRIALVLSAPCALGLAILGLPIISTLFMYGEFDSYDLLMTNKALYYYSIGVVALVLSRVLTSAFFGRQNTRTPVRIAVLTLFATQVMNLMFVWKLGHAGLALAIALAAWINVVLLSWNLYKQNILVPQKRWGIFLIRVFIALFVMALVLNFIVPLDEFWLNQIAGIKILNLILMVLVGAISYFLVLLLTGMRVSDFTKLNFLS